MKQKEKNYFSKKKIWITGASSGIGEAICNYLDQHCECHLILSGRNKEKLTQLSSKLKNKTTLSIFDVSQKEECLKAVEKATKDGPIDIVILNAGNCFYVEPHSFNSSDHEDMIKINYLSITYLIEGLLPQFLSRNKGHIVTVSSLAGLLGFPRSTAYGASKAASLIFTQCLQQDLQSSNISITSVLPGFVKTPLTDKNDFKMPFLMDADKAAEIVYKKLLYSTAFEISFPFRFALIMRLITMLPWPLYKKVMLKKVRK